MVIKKYKEDGGKKKMGEGKMKAENEGGRWRKKKMEEEEDGGRSDHLFMEKFYQLDGE